jgi:hypothetical protein
VVLHAEWLLQGVEDSLLGSRANADVLIPWEAYDAIDRSAATACSTALNKAL